MHLVKLIERKRLGLRVVRCDPNTTPHAYLVYQETFSDGTRKVVNGSRVYGTTMNPAHTSPLQRRPELAAILETYAVLNRSLECACAVADAELLPKVRD